MPRGDRTGPNGMGPMTGRATGFCTGNDRPGYTIPGYGGYGRGHQHRNYNTDVPFRRSYGRWGANPYAAPVQYTPEQELAIRRKEIEMMETELKAAREHLAELEKEAD